MLKLSIGVIVTLRAAYLLMNNKAITPSMMDFERDLFLQVYNGYKPMLFFLYQVYEYKERIHILRWMIKHKVTGALGCDFIVHKFNASGFRFSTHVIRRINMSTEQLNVSDLIHG